jgi:hypothetical protein
MKFYLIPIFNSIWFAYKMYMLIMHLYNKYNKVVVTKNW